MSQVNSQDWTSVQIHNPSKMKVVKKIIARTGCSAEKDELHKIENTDDTFKHTYIPRELSKEIMQLRTSKKYTQKEMAHKLNIQPSIYIDIENGKSIYNTETKKNIQKMERMYNILFTHKK
jgi:ribosome-binding protein aMBF1 (putative translation factor)